MTPLERVRIEKAATDYGFDLTPHDDGGWIVLRSSAFPELVRVTTETNKGFVIEAKPPLIFNGSVEATDIHALHACLAKAAATARNIPNRIAQQFIQQTHTLQQTTEIERGVVQRIGQGLFRTSLLDYWGGVCCVTGLALPELLRASRIRPWARCDTNEERLDVFNGLLLSPNVDALFDGGWITFSDAGRVVISEALPNEEWKRLGLDASVCVHGICPEHRSYLTFHRGEVFRVL
ncbi:hypothetical protein GCM10027046_13240 [Uliginosibacterium flavum]|uniref:HNH endonuclease signature motif containing protein n=1 Tax=Uliginosibacterium flavum TaxID=1396831 RepID=A0ABV2TQ03_9RHOO